MMDSTHARPGIRFVETPNAMMIREAAEWAVYARRPVLITGPAGVGKSTTLNEIAARSDGKAAFVTACPTNKSLRSLLIEVCDAFGFPNYHRNLKDVGDILLQNLGYRVEAGYYLIVDEVQILGGETLRQLLFYWDMLQLPIIFAGNEHALKRTRATAAAYDQIESRIARRITIKGVTEDDVTAFCVEFNVEGKDAHALAARFGKSRSLRDTVGLLQQARRMAGETGSIRREHIAEALVHLYGRDTAAPLLRAA